MKELVKEVKLYEKVKNKRMDQKGEVNTIEMEE